MRKAIVFFLLLFGICACSSDPSTSFKSFDEGPVISVVNEDTVTAEFFNQAYIQHIINTGRNDTKEERYHFLNSLTDDLLLAQKATEYGVVDSAFTSYMDQVERISIADRFYSASFLDSLSLPTEEQIQAAFFNTKIKMHVSHLFFTDRSDAQEAYRRLESGETFLDLANEIYNIQGYDSTAGYLGEISYFNVDDAFGEAAYELKAGEYSEPVRSRQGFHIIYVNHRIANPIITRAEFEYKKRGITGLTKERIKTLKGDAFVRSYMQSLDIQVDRSAVEQLYRSLQEIKPRSKGGNPFGITQEVGTYPSSAEVEFVRKELEPNTVLARYEHMGELKFFRAEDYFGWLKTIPLEEAQISTMASVGRALRNQVFYEAGASKNLINDPIVQYNIDYKEKFYKAFRVKQHLSEQPTGEISEEEQRAAFYGMGMNTSTNRSFSGWVITADNFSDAQEIKNQIESGKAAPDSFQFFESYTDEDPRMIYALQTHVFNAPLNTPVVANTKDAFYVMEITERDQERRSFEEARAEVKERMSKYYNVLKELKKLRQNAEIKVDTSAFEGLMEHFDDPALKGRR